MVLSMAGTNHKIAFDLALDTAPATVGSAIKLV